MTASVLGLDIGGANLKAAHTSGAAQLLPFELWQSPDGLTAALRELVRRFPASPRWAITMTGELCDCFETKERGVNQILDAVARAAQDVSVQVWRTDGCWVGIDAARATPLLTAASNWLALATFAGRYVPIGPAVLVDIGSTTVDIVPLQDGLSIARGRTDPERLAHRELLYMGVRRTPVCALLGSQVAAELFATTLDAYLLLGYLPEDPSNQQTADHRPATRAAAHARLARMYCADAVTCSQEQTQALARAVLRRQVALLGEAVTEVSAALSQPPAILVSAGSGEFLLWAALQDQPPWKAPVVSLAARLGPEISEAACAYALAVLAAEQCHAAR